MRFPSTRVLLLIVCAVASGCAATTGEMGKPASLRHTPERFRVVFDEPFDRARAPQVLECVTDAFQSPVDTIHITSMRQARRAAGYRVDIHAGNTQYVVADVLDAGRLSVRQSDYDGLVKFDRELQAARACVSR